MSYTSQFRHTRVGQQQSFFPNAMQICSMKAYIELASYCTEVQISSWFGLHRETAAVISDAMGSRWNS